LRVGAEKEGDSLFGSPLRSRAQVYVPGAAILTFAARVSRMAERYVAVAYAADTTCRK
jgi:hypothetical protein